MPSINITDDQYDRIITLRDELADKHSTQYTSVTLPDVFTYLLDLSESVPDPQREATIETEQSPAHDENAASDSTRPTMAPAQSFPRDKIETRLSERNLRHSGSDSETPMDLYDIAAEYDISGRSNMTKQELITAILDAAETLYTDPFAPVDVEFPVSSSESNTDANTDTPEDDDNETSEGKNTDTNAPTDDDNTDDGQLDAMLSLLETHSDKWSSADGDARYEVELPDGTTESARTKDDVRAALFKHY
jgi:hypothetical protein